MNGLKVLMLLMMIMRNLLLVPNGKIERFVCANFFDIKKVENGRTPQLCRPRFESQAHHVHLSIFVSCEKDNNKQKEVWIGPHRKKNVEKTIEILQQNDSEKQISELCENIRRFVRLKFNGLIGQNCKSVSNLYLDWLK